eukprot:14687102-Alexandrium_andersonii.AAC.1
MGRETGGAHSGARALGCGAPRFKLRLWPAERGPAWGDSAHHQRPAGHDEAGTGGSRERA